MIQRRAHTIEHDSKKKNITLKLRYSGDVLSPGDILLMIGEAWYHDIKKFGNDPAVLFEEIHRLMKDWPIDRSPSTS